MKTSFTADTTRWPTFTPVARRLLFVTFITSATASNEPQAICQSLLQKPSKKFTTVLMDADQNATLNAARERSTIFSNRTMQLAYPGNESYGSVLPARKVLKRGVLSIKATVQGTPESFTTQYIHPKVFHWCLFVVASSIAILLRRRLPSLDFQRHHSQDGFTKVSKTLLCLVAWILLGFLYAFMISHRIGQQNGIDWLAGYTLEFVFLIDNILILQAIIQAFKLSPQLTASALNFVVWGQVIFEAVFFMDFSSWLRKSWALPYMLGIWMIYFGVSTFSETAEEEASSPGITHLCKNDETEKYVQESETGFAGMKSFLAGFQLDKDASTVFIFQNGRCSLSVLGATTFALLIADGLIEIDAVLTKIEEFRNPYVAFSSSALASFAIPELFALNHELIKCFPLLKVGIGIILCFLGMQMLMASVYVMPPSFALWVILLIVVSCMLLSTAQSCCMARAEKQRPICTDC